MMFWGMAADNEILLWKSHLINVDIIFDFLLNTGPELGIAVMSWTVAYSKEYARNVLISCHLIFNFDELIYGTLTSPSYGLNQVQCWLQSYICFINVPMALNDFCSLNKPVRVIPTVRRNLMKHRRIQVLIYAGLTIRTRLSFQYALNRTISMIHHTNMTRLRWTVFANVLL